MAFKIESVERAGTRLVIAFAGPSGAGKTYTALKFAEGLAGGDATKVGFLDTENGRGRLYADILNKPFQYMEFDPPFTPDRFVEALDYWAQAKKKIEVLVIDSVSHEYEGTGGILEMQSGYSKGVKGWQVVKNKHKRFVNRMLQAPFHIVCCVRAREKMDFTDANNPKKKGIEPIQEKNFMYEMTASLLLESEGHAQKPIKLPAALRGSLGRERGYITPEDGEAVRLWVEGGTPVDPEVDQALGRLRMATEGGEVSLREEWAKIPKKIRARIGTSCPPELKDAAASYDAIKREQSANGEQSEASRAIAQGAK